MRVLVAGATGVVGIPTVRALLAAGYEVQAIARKPASLAALRAQGVAVAEADALDPASVLRAFETLRPEAVVHQLTALPAEIRPKKMALDLAATNRLRSEGTCNLLAAARAVGAKRFVAQSIAFICAPTPEGPEGAAPELATEGVPLHSDPRDPGFHAMVSAVADLEREVTAFGGVVLRYGLFYGPGTAFDEGGSFAMALRKRRMPVVGAGGGGFSFIHVHDAASAAVAALRADRSGLYNIVDDDPAPAREVLPALAEILGAKRPWHIPIWLGRLGAGRYGVFMLTRMRAVSNAKAKAELGWTPAIGSWRSGMRDWRTRSPD